VHHAEDLHNADVIVESSRATFRVWPGGGGEGDLNEAALAKVTMAELSERSSK